MLSYRLWEVPFSSVWWFSVKMPIISSLTSILSALKDQIHELNHTHLIPIGDQFVICAQATLVMFNP